MKSKQITINGVEITAFEDGSIEKPWRGKWTKLTFGTKHHSGYMHVRIGKKSFTVHRIVARALFPNFLDYPEVDHIDGDKSNNCINNLRMVTRTEQMSGHLRARSGISSKYRGVSHNKRLNKWQADCQINGTQKYIGIYGTEREAAVARDSYVFSQGFALEGLNFPENHKNP